MNRISSIVLLIVVVGAVAFLVFKRCSHDVNKEPEEITANIYMVAFDGAKTKGKIFGCNDILVPVPLKLTVESSDLETALNELLKQKDTPELHNFVKGPGLMLIQVLIANNLAEVYLRGDFDISTKCDIDRIREQLYETAKQFGEYKAVKFYVGDKTLEQYLTIAETGFK